MTTEEIEKAAQVESDKLILYCSKDDFKRGFIKGFELSDKHWQEKTRWVPVKERLPEVRDTPYCIAIKWEDFEEQEESVGLIYIYDEEDIDYISLEQITHWKEIE